MSKKRSRFSGWEGILFIAPWFVGLLAFMAFPLGFSLYMSFHRVQILPTRIDARFVGLDYYKEILLSSSVFYEELVPYLLEITLMLPIILTFALLVAILLNQRFKGRFFFRTVFFLPVVFSTGYVVTEFVNQGQGALGFLERLDLEGAIAAAFGGTAWGGALTALLDRFVLVLWYSGVQILIFLAGRQTIPKSSYEAARIDGAGPWETFWKITLPALVPFVYLNLVYTVVDLFTFPFNPVIRLISTGNYGYSSALVWIYFLIILCFLGITLAVFARAARRPKAISRA